jgi:YD repeat-containing protein
MWCRDGSGTVTAFTWIPLGAALRITSPQMLSETTTRTSGWSVLRRSQWAFTKVPRRRWRRITPSSASSESARLTGVRLIL